MNIKKTIIIFMILICCGCKAKYRIDFIDDKIKENLSVNIKRNNLTDEQVKEMYSEAFYAINRESFYNFNNKKSTLEEIKLDYDYDFDTNNIASSNLIRTCVEHFDFFKEDDKYYLIATGAFKCSMYEYVELDSLDVSITTNHNIIENNADEIKNNEYIWHVDLNNLEKINIKLITDDKQNYRIKQKEYKTIIIIASTVLGVLLLITLVLFIKHKRVNKI